MRIVSRFLIILNIVISIFLLFIIIFHCSDLVTLKENIEIVLISIVILIFLIYAMLSYHIQLKENSLILKIFMIKREIKYTDVKEINSAFQPGCYWINTSKNEMIFFMLPLAHKSINLIFDKIQEKNPNVIIHVNLVK